MKSLGKCLWHVPRDLINSFKGPERLVRLEWERHRSTGTDGGKIALSVTKGSWARFLPGREINLRFGHKAMRYAMPASISKL